MLLWSAPWLPVTGTLFASLSPLRMHSPRGCSGCWFEGSTILCLTDNGRQSFSSAVERSLIKNNWRLLLHWHLDSCFKSTPTAKSALAEWGEMGRECVWLVMSASVTLLELGRLLKLFSRRCFKGSLDNLCTLGAITHLHFSCCRWNSFPQLSLVSFSDSAILWLPTLF